MSSTTTHTTTTQPKRIRKASKGTQAAPVSTKSRRTPSAATKTARPAYADLSFVRGGPTRHGWASSDLFAVPEQDYGDGWITGLRAFQELQQLVKTQAQDDNHIGLAHWTQWIIEAAFQAREADRDAKGASKRSAACAFTQCVGQFMSAMLRANDGRYMAEVIACHQKTTDHFKARDAQQRAAFIARMQAARAAKRAAREAATAPTAAEQLVKP